MSDRASTSRKLAGAVTIAATLGSVAFGTGAGVARDNLAEGIAVASLLMVISIAVASYRVHIAAAVGDDRQAAHTRQIAGLESRVGELEVTNEQLLQRMHTMQETHERERAVDQRRYITKLAFLWSYLTTEVRSMPGFPTLKELINGDWEPASGLSEHP